jgi:hypothetical protein
MHRRLRSRIGAQDARFFPPRRKIQSAGQGLIPGCKALDDRISSDKLFITCVWLFFMIPMIDPVETRLA